MERNPCDIYACREFQDGNATVTALVDGETIVLEVCKTHRQFFEEHDPAHYSIGRTFTGEVEVRAISSQPADPSSEPEE